MNRDFKIGYLQGLFDGEGHLSKQHNIIITNTRKSIIDVACKYLDELGIAYTLGYQDQGKWKRAYRIFITRDKEVDKFIEIVGSVKLFDVCVGMSNDATVNPTE